jgi:hypothetical protein
MQNKILGEWDTGIRSIAGISLSPKGAGKTTNQTQRPPRENRKFLVYFSDLFM